MELKYILFGVLLCYSAGSVLCTANSGANGKTKKLLAALSNLRGKVLSGVFGGYNNHGGEIGFSLDQANRINQYTGKSPAVYGIDCSPGWLTAAAYHEADIIECMHPQAVEYANRGGFITVSHHLPNPQYAGNRNKDGDGAFKTNITNTEFAAILQEGAPQRNRWWNMMEKIAKGLQGYKDRGITVLYRPLHEMNGDWFWWGALQDESQNGERQRLYKLLWQDLFYFMQKKGLDNLLWVWSPDQSRAFKTNYYPGDNFVDIVGLDGYVDNPTQIQGYDEISRLGKPFAFAEVGPSTTNGQFDYDWFVKTIASKYPKTVYFMPWNAEWSPVNNKNPWGAYNNGIVLNLGELRVR
ncbi:mannan endo-1,4-beta-mannosidase [Halyomorpha halys]|uniref:mannan endo-1,4-beta-mannosidase n=1 Tax=Halyomorpha halys TaxID=286706 RepID=UPI0006D51084|nr:uncharacterized protein LOC106689100 [Halyomorpha halys]